ncbi:MAG: primase [Bacteroidota bacterium]
MISKETIQLIQGKIDIIEIIGGFVKLKKRGTNYLGNCPFHNEKTPSFTVSPSKEIYKCFGCGKSGNTIGFIMDHEKYSYVETLRWLANKYNITIEETESSPEAKAYQQVTESLFIVNHYARDFFRDQLRDTEEGIDIAMSYLTERGFTPEIIEKFQIGYNPGARDALAQSAIAAQYNPEIMNKAGLIVQRDGHWQDNYRGRIIFPIHNQSGKVIGFGARIIKSNDRAPKYINTPENELYVKSKILYGAYFAKSAIDKANECLLVEGYTDVVSLHQAGVENVVASGGTSLTTDQLRLIKKYTPNLTIIYDGDGAGIKAAMRGLDLALEEGLNVKLVLIPDNEDPDSYVKKIGASDFKAFVSREKKDFILFQLDVALKDAQNDSVKRSNIVQQMAETLSKINKTEDFAKRQDYVRRVSEMLNIEESGFNALVNKFLRDKIGKEQQQNFQTESIPFDEGQTNHQEDQYISDLVEKDQRHEQAIVRSLIEFGTKNWDDEKTVADFIFSELDELELMQQIQNEKFISILNSYRSMISNGQSPTLKDFMYHEDHDLQRELIRIMENEPDLSPKWEEHYQAIIPKRDDLYREEILSNLYYLQLRKIKKLMAENQAELEKTKDPEQQLLILQTHQLLKNMENTLSQKRGTVIYKS